MPDNRDELAKEFARLSIKIAPDQARIAELKEDLKAVAGDAGNYRVAVDGKGTVKVSGPADPKFKGIFPTINIDAFLALGDAARDKLVKDGIVTMKATYGEPYYGRVEFEPFKQRAA